MMPPTTEIELNEVNEAPAGSPIKKVGKGLARAGTATKKKVDAVYTDVRQLYQQTSFTPNALKPVDKSVIIFLFLSS